jgi:hypothetical protein
VELTYQKKLETLEELLNSDVVYGYHPIINFFQETAEYSEAVAYAEQKALKEDCSDIQECVERMIRKRDIAMIYSPFLASYVAREMGTVDVGKIICSLDETFITGGAVVLFKKGNPLLDRFNSLMRRCLEAGLLEMHWTELQHRASLRGAERLREVGGDVFFAFSVSHLLPAFVVLLVGTALSSVVFIAELIVNCLCKRRIKKKLRLRRVRLLNLLNRINYVC